MRGTKILIKFLYIHFLFCTAFLFVSCPPGSGRYTWPSHPGDIVTDVGTLKYIRTLWDMTTIQDGQKIDNEIWIYTGTLFKGFDKSASVSIQYYGNKMYSIGSSYILPKGDYINFLASELYKGYRIFYIARVHRATMERQYIRMPKLDGRYWPSVYYGNGDVFFRHSDNGKYYMLNDACNNVIEITEQEFNDLYSGPDYVTDDEGRYYRLRGRSFAVSVDNGKTWHGNTAVDNFPRANIPVSIITQNGTVFILCAPEETYDIQGGGIHEFKWETEGGEE